MMLMLLMSSMTSVAQDGVAGSGIAIVEDHKRQRRVYALRTAIEEANRELHGLVADTVKGYKEVNFSLEKYTKSFELIQLILNGAYTAMNIYGTSNYVVGRVGDISRLLTEYYNELLSQGNIESGDLFIYEWSNQLVRGLSEDVSELVRSGKNTLKKHNLVGLMDGEKVTLIDDGNALADIFNENKREEIPSRAK